MAGGRVDGLSGVGIRLWSGYVTGTGNVKGSGSLAPTRMASTSKVDHRLLNGP